MWFLITAEAKEGVTLKEIQEKRKEWVERGIESVLQRTCKSVERFAVLGVSPRKAFWLIETEDWGISHIFADHFGDLWRIQTYHVVRQSLAEALRPKAGEPA